LVQARLAVDLMAELIALAVNKNVHRLNGRHYCDLPHHDRPSCAGDWHTPEDEEAFSLLCHEIPHDHLLSVCFHRELLLHHESRVIQCRVQHRHFRFFLSILAILKANHYRDCCHYHFRFDNLSAVNCRRSRNCRDHIHHGYRRRALRQSFA
jgi:hypothetical protein